MVRTTHNPNMCWAARSMSASADDNMISSFIIVIITYPDPFLANRPFLGGPPSGLDHHDRMAWATSRQDSATESPVRTTEKCTGLRVGKSNRNLELSALQTSSLHPRSHWSQYAAFPDMRISMLIWSSDTVGSFYWSPPPKIGTR